MQAIRIPDVGHGLAASLTTLTGKQLQIDCGSLGDRSAAAKEFRRVRSHDGFVLSHFHLDHYNGLAELQKNEIRVSQVYLPALPDIKEKRRLAESFMAISRRVLGPQTGHMHADLLNIIQTITVNDPSKRLLSRGDQFQLGSSTFEVLWPPSRLDSDSREAVERALGAFEEALNEDSELRRIHQNLIEREEVGPYLEDEYLLQDNIPENGSRREGPHQAERGSEELPEVVESANKSLRDVADHLSLAFHLDNRFLFLGDLRPREIREVLNLLISKDRTDFLTMITPHHGTRAHREIRKLRTKFAISSAGKQDIAHLKDIYKTISNLHWITYFNDDFLLPSGYSRIGGPSYWHPRYLP